MPRLGIPALAGSVDPLPAMTLARPEHGSTVTGRTVLDAVAPFNFGISRVTFSVTGGALRDVVVGQATSTRYGWITSWDTTAVENGPYAVRCTAYDSAGHSSACPAVPVTVSN